MCYTYVMQTQKSCSCWHAKIVHSSTVTIFPAGFLISVSHHDQIWVATPINVVHRFGCEERIEIKLTRATSASKVVSWTFFRRSAIFSWKFESDWAANVHWNCNGCANGTVISLQIDMFIHIWNRDFRTLHSYSDHRASSSSYTKSCWVSSWTEVEIETAIRHHRPRLCIHYKVVIYLRVVFRTIQTWGWVLLTIWFTWCYWYCVYWAC